MRYCIVALILQSVSVSVAVMEAFQTPHIPEDQKSFNCDGRIYNSHSFGQYRDMNGYFRHSAAADVNLVRRVSDVTRAKQTDVKYMYHDDSRRIDHLHLPIFESHPVVITRDTLIYDQHSRVCAIITQIGQPTNTPHRETRTVYDVSDTFCPIQQPNTHL
ncbi:BgTH12-03496 [Blumeria graminis f. sp. triticale]|uniref:Bgt-50480 n=2 Tax=Blumeria graminis TaxID=34373 RepID=A0A9X9L829_BLUGR|nr:BgTH12-03496 [Blumeria graminis f. sp. triticale]VCU39526.1 Bgt-50480 [Blumeria graminis f. sp. tritici]